MISEPYFCTALTLWAAWRVGRDCLPAEFSNNVILNTCWALCILAFLRAIRDKGDGWWLLLGVFAGLGLLAWANATCGGVGSSLVAVFFCSL